MQGLLCRYLGENNLTGTLPNSWSAMTSLTTLCALYALLPVLLIQFHNLFGPFTPVLTGRTTAAHIVPYLLWLAPLRDALLYAAPAWLHLEGVDEPAH
jgi:hypothetical protein